MSTHTNSLSIIQEASAYGFKPTLCPFNLFKGYGKNPVEENWIEKYSTISIDNLLKLAKNRLYDNVGILCGKYSNIIVIDVDKQNNGIENWTTLCENNNIFDIEEFNTPIVRSGSFGYHYYFKYNKKFEDSKAKLYNGIDVLSTGKQVVYPGSLYPGCIPLDKPNKKHKCGALTFDKCLYKKNIYEWIKSPADYEIQELPTWIENMIIKKPKNIKSETINSINEFYNNRIEPVIKETTESNFDINLLDVCLNELKNRSENYHEWRDTIWCIRGLGFDKSIAHYFSKFSNKYDPESVEKIWDDFDNRVSWNWGTIRNWLKESKNENDYKDFCQKYFNKVEDEFRLYEGDYGLALIFSEIYKGKLIITEEEGSGFLWDDDKKIYEEYGATYLSNLISVSLLPIVSKYIKISEEQIHKLTSTNNYNKNLESIYKAKHKELIYIKKYVLSTKGCKQIFTKVIFNLLNKEFVKLLDNDTEYLPIKNGKIINLKTTKTRLRTTTDFFTFECPVDYNTNNKEIVYNYIKSICNNDDNYTSFMIKFLGYLLTRETSDRSLYILWGKGMNGKSKLLELVEQILGKLFTSCSADVLLKTERKGGATPELIPLMSARVAVLNETDENEKLNSERIKKLTGDDLITARALFKNEITFRPKAKLLLITNKKPSFDAVDKAMTDRIKLLPFLASFENTIENRNYIEKLKTEYFDDFFSLIVDGCVNWWKTKDLSLPDVAKEATNEYFNENDTIKQWLKECCEEGTGEEYKEQPSILFERYCEWCSSNSCKKETKQKFGEIMVKNYGEKLKVSVNKKQNWYYKGVKIL